MKKQRIGRLWSRKEKGGEEERALQRGREKGVVGRGEDSLTVLFPLLPQLFLV